MKRADTALCLILISSLTAVLVLACKKNQTDIEEPVINTPASAMADTLANRLRFPSSIKKQGNAPAPPAGSALKSSIKDTLHISSLLQWPVQFLHLDTTKNVSGVWIQVRTSASTGFSSFYYEVPEVKEMEENDTISVVMIGMDPNGLQLPQAFETRIIPYDKNKQPLAERVFPTKVDNPKVDLPGNGASCGITLLSNEYWGWEMSIVPNLDANLNYAFYNQPGKIFSSGGVDIEGSCCGGSSRWPEFCVGEIQHNRTLHFATYYTIKFEDIWFLSNNTFGRVTLEDSPVPLPAESDFCNGGTGKLKESLKQTAYEGTWEIRPVTIPSHAPSFIRHATHELRLTTTGGTGTGYGNPGGVIHQLDCKTGSLVMVQAGGEGWRSPLVKFYKRIRSGELRWYFFQ